MDILQFFSLGQLDIRSDERQYPRPPTQKSQSLLAYLVMHRSRPHPRNFLAGLFFNQTTERKAHRSLSTALWHIHRCLPEETAILSDSQTVQFDPQNNIWLDVEEFELQAVRPDTASLHGAVTLYRGDFMQGLYDDWIISERYRLESLYLDALARLMVLDEAGKETHSALAVALRLLDRDALREDAHQVAMRAYCRLGQRKAALEQYERCRETVRKELDSEPMEETQELYQAILKGRIEVGLPPVAWPGNTLAEEHTGRDPLDVTSTARLTGRERETAFLEDCWRAAMKGNTKLALISGEVGVGKTLLVEAFANHLRWQGILVLWGRCYEFERSWPYQPIANALQASLPTLDHDQLAGIPTWSLREVARLVPDLMDAHANHRRKNTSDSTPGLASAPGMNPEQARFFAGVTRLLAELSTPGRLLLVLEDLHWASESTLLLLNHLACHLSAHPVLIIGTFRPEEHDWRHPFDAQCEQLTRAGRIRLLELARLSPAAVETIIMEMSGAGIAVGSLAKRLYQETEGNPFFLMEIIKALFETNAIWLKEGVWQGDFGQISQMEFPPSRSVSDTVQARVHRLGENVQDGLHLAAVLGREFNYELLLAAGGKGEEETLEILDELLRHKLIEEKAGPNESDFAFTHHKIQEAIYQALPRFHRCHLHARVGAAMETLYADELDIRTSELAHHYEQGCSIEKSLTGKAITYLLKAGEQAARHFANQEAIAYYRRGLSILQNQPETVIRMHQEVELQLGLAIPMTSLKGYASPEAKHVYDRAYHLCQKLGETTELFTSLVGLSRYYGVTGDLDMGSKLSNQLIAIAQASSDTDLLLEAYRQMGGNLFSWGRLEEAREYWENGLSLYHVALHQRHANRFGHDPSATCLGFLSMTLWLLGYPEQALAKSQDLYNLIPSFTHPASKAYAYCLLAMQACLRSATEDTIDHAEAAIHIAQSHGLSSWSYLAIALKGQALLENGEVQEGKALLQEGIKAWQTRGFAHFTPFLLSLQAAACLKLRKLNDGMDAVTAAQAIVKGGCDRYWEVELCLLQGELLSALGRDDQSVETCFRLGVETARQQGARMLELHAAMRLAHLWLDQDHPQAARQVLSETYGKFTEGFETRDLKAAGELLLALSQQPQTP